MSVAAPIPSLEQFLAAPIEALRPLMPPTFICALSGTRRAAALAGIPAQGQEYARWSHAQMLACVELLFNYNVQHLFLLLLGPSQFNEITPEYQENLWDWFEWGVAGPQAVEWYAAHRWRARIAFSAYLDRLRQAGERLAAVTAWPGRPTVWFCAIPDERLPLEWLLEAASQAQARTRPEALRALYGEEFPPASIYLGTGKPLLSGFQLPPLLVEGPLQAYWNQRPGYSLDDHRLRLLLYDYAYQRQTWQADKTGRAEGALEHRQAWEEAPILGVGSRLGDFWYPEQARK